MLKFAGEGTGWGASRIQDELTKPGVRNSDATVRRILQENGIDQESMRRFNLEKAPRATPGHARDL